MQRSKLVIVLLLKEGYIVGVPVHEGGALSSILEVDAVNGASVNI